jgi:hypothetical protein
MSEKQREIEKEKVSNHLPPWISSPVEFINTREFSREAQNFLKHGTYTNAPVGSYEYKSYWEEQHKRCMEGYSVGGVHIPGRYYDYLNFTQIKARVKTESGRERRITTFPSFLDIDYYYYVECEKAMDEGTGMIVGKARRKGFSFKNAQMCKYDYSFHRDSTSVIGAYLDEYSGNTMRMAVQMLNFLDKHTAFGRRRDIRNSKDHIISGYKEKVDGQEVIKGYNSQIYTLTFHNNASAAIGKEISFMLWEEAGKWNNIINSYNLTLPTFVDGDITTGFWVIFGTGGDMESGATAGFEELFYNPKKYRLRAYDLSQYDPDQQGEAGFFVDDAWYKPPHINSDGVSLRESAIKANLAKREELQKGAKSTKTLDDFLTQYPLVPAEAFLISTGAYFPAKLIMDRINKLTTDKKLANIGMRGEMILEGQKPTFYQQQDSYYEAPFPFDPKNKKGCVVIYEHPEKIGDSVPFGLYLASTDPYMHDDSTTDSLGSTFIYKKFYSAEKTHDIIVAEYTGRPETSDEYYEQVRLLLLYYNAKCLYENQFKDMKTYFQNKNSLHLLAPQPMIVKDIIPKSEVNRGYGVHMPIQLKQAAVIYLKEWFKTPRSATETNIDFIYSVPLLQEALRFNFNGNFDRISSLLILMLYIQENKKIQLNAIEKDRQTNKFDTLRKDMGWNK